MMKKLGDHRDTNCGKLSPHMLTEILGAAFNSRYMSLEQPLEDSIVTNSAPGDAPGKRQASFPPFYVDDKYALEISRKPAWEVQHVVDTPAAASGNMDRSKREAPLEDDSMDRIKRTFQKSGPSKQDAEQWVCKAKIRWIELGPDYYPPYLRTVECVKHDCWYRLYSCKPRSFTVKLLRRRKGECVPTGRLSFDGMPGEMRELWVWEERAVNFCCDCSRK